jgi:hypothetical protein
VRRREVAERGIVIAFDDMVQSRDLTTHAIAVLVPSVNDRNGAVCWCEAHIELVPARLSDRCRADGEWHPVTPGDPADAVVIHLELPRNVTEARVRFDGDFVRDVAHGRAVDADHLPKWLPGRLSGDGVEGGTFWSWFTISSD